MRRIVITGMGAISAAGIGASALWDAARDGVSGVSPLEFDRSESNRIKIAASVPDTGPGSPLNAAMPVTSERFTHFALIAAKEAIDQSGLQPDALANSRTAAVIGTGVGGIGTFDEGTYRYYHGQRVDPMSVPRVMPSSAVSHVGIAHGITGPSFGVTSACASATQSIGMAAMLIRAGIVDRAVTGGAEACITPGTMRAWELLRVLTPRACRPFAADRSGMVIGEGAGILVIEAEETALARGATPIAYLAGYGTTSDARDMVQPDVNGAAGAMQQALDDAGLGADAIGYINAHGTGTILNDINETAAMRQVFGNVLDTIPVSSSKPIVGHALGAAGALELVVTVQALVNRTVPPQANMTTPDAKCDLFLPVDGPLEADFDAALCNSFAFGGINASLLVQRAS